MKARITKRAIEALPPGKVIVDTDLLGFMVRKLPSGVVTFGYRYRTPDGNRRWMSLGVQSDTFGVDDARRAAAIHVGAVASNQDPAATRDAGGDTVNALLDEFIDRYLKKQQLRSADAIEGTFNRHVRPRIGAKSIYSIKRSDVVSMLDAIEDAAGPVMADRTLAFVRKAFNWRELRDDEFKSPIVRGMVRVKPNEHRRTRILDDQEIKDVLTAVEQISNDACYARFIRLLLLTGQRRENVSHMVADEIKGDGWLIPAARNKTKIDHFLPLTTAARALIGTRKNGFLISSDDGKTGFSGYSKAKAALDRKIAELRKKDGRKPMPHWVLHDLRRTARSIMSRYTTPDIAERVIGHVIPGVRGVYDLHEYADEKRAALEALAAHIARIGKPGTVVPFPKRGKTRKAA